MRRLLMRPWSEEEVAILNQMIAAREPVWRIARRLRRSESAVRGKMVKLGVPLPTGTRTIRQLRREVFPTTPS